MSHLRKKPSTQRSGAPTRDSNMVRASVLDAAMQLGFGDPNSTVASWMFSNPVTEEDEEEEAATPDFATSQDSHSNSPSTSNSHNPSFPYTPRTVGAGPNAYRDTFPFPVDSPSSSVADVSIPFPSADYPSQNVPRSKLGGGDDSDGALTSNSKKEDKGDAKARKRSESKAAKEREREEKKARKEEERAKKRANKGYDADGAVSDGAYLSEGSVGARPRTKSLTTKWSRTKMQSKSDAEGTSSSGFFRRKSKPTKPSADIVPPMPTRSFTPLVQLPPPSSGPLLSVPADYALTSGPPSADSTTSSWLTVTTTPSDLSRLPPIAARFASTSIYSSLPSPSPSLSPPAPPPVPPTPSLIPPTPSLIPPTPSPVPPTPSPVRPTPSPVPPTTSRPSTATSVVSEADTSSQASTRPRPRAVPVLPPPARIHDYDHEEGDGTTSSRSSEISMPASLPTSVSSPSASPHYKPPLRRMPSSPPPSKSKGGRPGIFGFKSSGSISTDKRKLEISLPLTNRNPDAVAGSSGGASFIPGQSMPNGSSGSGAGAVQPTRKPTLEVRTQNPPREPSTLSALSPPSVYPSSTASPAPASSSSYVMVTPATSSDSYTHPFAAIAAKSNAPVPPLKVQPRKTRPNMIITHPHNYTGAEADSLQPPRRMSHIPVPPPTPPPTGPLPPPPGAWESKLTVPSPLNVRAPSPSGQRGKDLPFGVGRGQGPDREKIGKLDGYEERMKVPRYRELYPGGGRADGPSTPPRPQPTRTKSYESNPYPMVYTDDEEDDEEDVDSDQPLSPEEIQKEMTQIRGRFNADDRERFSAASVPVTEPGDMYNDSFAEEEDSMATPHKSFEYEQLNSFSFSSAPRDSSGAGQRASNGADEAAEGGEDPEEDEIYSPVHVELNDDADDDKSIYAEEDRTAGRRTIYDTELLGGRSAGDTESHYWDEGRMSRYSAAPSVYSVLDGEQSEEARQRFLKKVAAMYTEGADVPPMPTLAESYSGRNVIKEPGVGRRRMI